MTSNKPDNNPTIQDQHGEASKAIADQAAAAIADVNKHADRLMREEREGHAARMRGIDLLAKHGKIVEAVTLATDGAVLREGLELLGNSDLGEQIARRKEGTMFAEEIKKAAIDEAVAMATGRRLR